MYRYVKYKYKNIIDMLSTSTCIDMSSTCTCIDMSSTSTRTYNMLSTSTCIDIQLTTNQMYIRFLNVLVSS